MFPGNKCSEGWSVPVWGLQAMVQSTTICFKLMVLAWEETLLTYAWKHEKLTSCQSKGWEVSHCLTVVDLWTMILLPVLCETICAISPLRAFWGALFVKMKKTPYWQPYRCKLWPKMAQELNPHVGWKEWSRHNNTKIQWNTSDPTSTLAL